MPKRSLPEHLPDVRPVKRARPGSDRLSSLSDELILRVLSYLPIHDLNVCQRVSSRLQEISGDSQLWKAAYYERFVRPRVLRLPGRKFHDLDPRTLAHSSRLSRWLDEGNLVKRGISTNWKRQYKIRHNWSQGNCDVNQIPVTSRPPSPPLLARLHNGIIYTVDSASGLRAWSYKAEKKLLATRALEHIKDRGSLLVPTSFAIDSQDLDATHQQLIIGYENGGFSVYTYAKLEAQFLHQYTHPPSSNGCLLAVAVTMPYILTMTDSQVLSLYNFNLDTDQQQQSDLAVARLLTSLKSHTTWPPVSLGLRNNRQDIVASIAYCLPTYNSSWTVGIQELHVAPDGSVSGSRLTSAIPQGFTSLGCDAPRTASTPTPISPRPEESAYTGLAYSKPTSLSYSHPYILVSHSDNTLTLYLATSNASDLSISAGRRLFGHTSAVFSAHVGARGKAVSVGIRGDEVRVWELEGATNSLFSRSRNAAENLSVQVTPDIKPTTPEALDSLSNAIKARGIGFGLALDSDNDDWLVTRGWVGFDDENLIVLRDQKHGGQALAVYDFS